MLHSHDNAHQHYNPAQKRISIMWLHAYLTSVISVLKLKSVSIQLSGFWLLYQYNFIF